MTEGCFIEQAVEVFPFAEFKTVLGGQESQDRVDGEGYVASPKIELGAIAGSEHDNFIDSLGTSQFHQSGVSASFADPESFAHFNRCGAVVQSDYGQRRFHDGAPVLQDHFTAGHKRFQNAIGRSEMVCVGVCET